MKNWTTLFLTICLCWNFAATAKSTSNTTGSISLPKRTHPYLFLQKDEFKQLAEFAGSSGDEWARKHYDSIVARADAALASELEVPAIPGEWAHHYVCEDCGIRLRGTNGRHECPRCEREYTGWPFDGVAASGKHAQNIADAENLGLAWQLTGNAPYAERVVDILLAYADVYESFPIHDFRGGSSVTGARLTAQTLDESVRMISVAWAYDLVADSPASTDMARRTIRDKLLLPAAEVIRRNDKGISNWQSWHNAAMAAIGFVVDDAELVDHAVNGPSGIRFQMEESVLSDGFWYEGTASYHFYALNALQQQVLAMKAAGMDFYRDPVFRSMYQAPLDYMFPDGSFPAVNDSSPLPVARVANHYELAYAWYGEPQFGAMAQKGNRQSREAFLWGAKQLPKDAAIEPGSKNFPGLGAVTLRQNSGTDDAMAVHLDYGPHGGGHGHNDKLGIILFANGHDIMPDAGRLYYGAPLHNRWYKRTIAHNTVVVDGKDQAQTEGELFSTSFSGEIQLATAICHTAYEGVELTRSLALAPDYLLDVVSGNSQARHTWDLACHVYGSPLIDEQETSSMELLQKSDGYQVLANIRELPATPEAANSGMSSHTIELQAKQPYEGRIKLTVIGSGPTQFILADGKAGEDATTCPVVLARQQNASDPIWITLVNPRGDQGDIDLSAWEDDGNWRVSVTSDRRTDEYLVHDGELTALHGSSR